MRYLYLLSLIGCNFLGGPLKYSLEGHNFAIFGCSLTNDKRYVVSISNRFISWDVNTSEVCRDIDPRYTRFFYTHLQ